MASKDHNVEEQRVDSAIMTEKANAIHNEDFHSAAERGHVATDK